MASYPMATIYGRLVGNCDGLIIFPNKRSARISLMNPDNMDTFDLIIPNFSDLRVGEFLSVSGSFCGNFSNPFFYYHDFRKHDVSISSISKEKAKNTWSCLRLSGELSSISSIGNGDARLSFSYFAGDKHDSDTNKCSRDNQHIDVITDNSDLIDKLSGEGRYSFYGRPMMGGNSFRLYDID